MAWFISTQNTLSEQCAKINLFFHQFSESASQKFKKCMNVNETAV